MVKLCFRQVPPPVFHNISPLTENWKMNVRPNSATRPTHKDLWLDILFISMILISVTGLIYDFVRH